MSTPEEITDINSKLSCLQNKIDDIHTALVGNDYDKEKALIPRLKKVEKYIETDKKLKWIGAGALLALGTSIKSAWDWISNHV